jgi:SOS-response transcriptional repressor LexA
VVAYHRDEYTFRQLRIRDDKWYLSALNDLYPTEQISGPDAVKGVVIQKKKPGRRSSMKSYI